jgi:hypothetical protein
MNINKKARELMAKYPDSITVGEIIQEVPDEKQRREVFARMVFFIQEQEMNRILGPNLIRQ